MRKIATALAISVVILVSLGLVMLASTSSVRGSISFGDPYFFIKRQIIWLMFSVFIATLFYYFDYHWWEKLGIPLAVFSLVMLVMVIIPPFRREINGSSRWLILGGFRFQPSEIMKLSVVIMLSLWMTNVGRRTCRFKEGFLWPLCGLGLTCGLVLLEPDFGTAALIFIIGLSMLFIGGTKIIFIVGMMIMGGMGILLMALKDPVRVMRILAFLWPDKYPETAYHVTQSKFAFMAGKTFGVGLGNSIQKHLYLPEAHTDFIFAIIGEELGILATIFVVISFIGILICGVTISAKSPDLFGRYLAFGFTFMITLQAAINIAVVTGCFPTKGLPLPFISYGGSSLVSSLVSIAMLMNIAKHSISEGDEHTQVIKDRSYQW